MASRIDLIDRKSLPPKHLLVSVGEGPIFQYTACGLDSVYVEGCMREHESWLGWYWVSKVEEVHHQIGTQVLATCQAAGSEIGAAYFRFMRKEMGLTIEEVCCELGLDGGHVEAWEAGRGFATAGVRGILALFLEYRELGYVEFRKQRRERSLAA